MTVSRDEIKQKAIALRRKGKSIRDIEIKLGVARSTLSGWLRHVELSEEQKQKLEQRWRQALVSARKGALVWHNGEKAKRVEMVEKSAQEFLTNVAKDNSILEVALAFLYLGEGAKTQSRTSLGSSDIRIARFFVESIMLLYEVPKDKIHCNLHLRADQNSDEMIEYWSSMLHLPRTSFGKSSFDIRTRGRATYSTYKGVCLITCGRVDIQRRLMYIANGLCDMGKGSFERSMRA